MRVLVTGATGRVGSRLAPRLLENGIAVRALVRKAEQAEALQAQGVEAVIGDLLQPEASAAPDTLMRAVSGVDAIVHLAAFFRSRDTEQIQAVNEAGTQALAQAAHRVGITRFIYISTNLVYGPGRGRPATELDEPRPAANLTYPVSKLAAERYLQALFGAENPPLIILRLPFVYGDGDPHLAEASRLAENWPAAMRLQMAHHADVAQAIRLALASPQACGKIYNVADDRPITIPEIARLNHLPVDGLPDPPAAETWEGIVDTSRIRQDLGYRPIYPSVFDAERAGVL